MNIFLTRCSAALICGILLTIGLRKQLTSFDITLPIYAVLLSVLIIAAVLFCLSLFIKKNNVGYVAFLTVLGAVPLTMLLSFNYFGDISLRENKRLAKLPTVFVTNERFPRQMDTYIDERMGLKYELLDITGLMLLLNDGDKPSFDIDGRAVIGIEDWLFINEKNSTDNSKDFQRVLSFTQKELTKIRESFEYVNNTLKEAGIPLIVIIAPSKHNVYPEYYSPVYNQRNVNSKLEQVVKEMKKSDVDIVELLPVLYEAKKDGQIYFKHDSHWTIDAGYVAYLELMKHFQKIYKDVFIVERELFHKVPANDLLTYDLLVLSSVFKPKSLEGAYNVSYNDNFTIQSVPGLQDGRHSALSFKGQTEGPKVFLVHDSFAMAIAPFLERSAGDFILRREWGISPLKYINTIKKEKPDVVIWEMHERSLANLADGSYKKQDNQE